MSSKDSTTKPSIQEIFDNMEYGSVSEGKSLAEKWLLENAANLGPFVNGKLNPQQSEGLETITTGVDSCTQLKLNKQQDYVAAISAASSSFSTWSALEGHARAKIIYSIARQLQKHVSLLCEVEAMSRGVQVSNVREFDAPALIRTFYYYAGWAQLVQSDLSNMTPYGPVVGVMSSSAPLTSLAMFVAPALAAGNTVTLLPHVSNCMSALLLAQICSTSGVPPGVINVAPQEQSNSEISNVIMDHRVRKIGVIGSPSIGRALLAGSEQNEQSVVMLLNGCVPMIILESADLDAAVDCAVDAAWINQGQDPWSLRLLIVQEAVYDVVKSKLIARISSMKIGGTFDKMADVSDNVVDESLAQKLQEVLALNSCSEVVQSPGARANKWSPTVIFSPTPPATPVLELSDACPVLHVVGARSAKEAIGIANHCGAGAAASIWSESSSFAWESSLQLKVGTVWVNSHGVLDACIPVSGRNLSGRGCFLGKEGLIEFLQTKRDLETPVLKAKSSSCASLLPLGHSTNEPSVDQTYKLFYGGGHKRPNSNSYRTLVDGSGKPVAVVPEANRKDVRNAVEAAVKAQAGWWKRGPHNRAQILYNLAEKLEARRSYFASHLQAVYQNVDLEKCMSEVEEGIKLLFLYAGMSDKMLHTSAQSSVNGMAVTVLREPLGTVAVVYMSSTGSALVEFIALVGAALAFGNTCVVAPQSDCPTPALELAQLLEAAEVPAGIVNILSGATETLLPTLCGHMEVNAIWCVGHQPKLSKAMQEESSKSNLKKSWIMEQVLDPSRPINRQEYEVRASQSKAIWVPVVASFGS